MTFACHRWRALIVGSVARMRVSSRISPVSLSSGTLESTRTKTRLPSTSMSRMVFFFMGCPPVSGSVLLGAPAAEDAEEGRGRGQQKPERVPAVAAAVLENLVVAAEDVHDQRGPGDDAVEKAPEEILHQALLSQERTAKMRHSSGTPFR